MLETVITECDSQAAAQAAASEFATNTGGRVFPVIISTQGSRIVATTSFSFGFFKTHVKFDPVKKGDSPRSAINRPIMQDHVDNIRNYVIENLDSYFLPPVTLNLKGIAKLCIVKGNAVHRLGYIIIDDGTQLYITDGQHRIAALVGPKGVCELHPETSNHSLSAMITMEHKTERIHQDFADAARSKPIPPSLLAAYNMREPINRILTKIVDESPILHGRVDEVSKTLSKKSNSIFLLNQVRQLLKELVVGDWGMSEDSFQSLCRRRLGTVALQDEFIAQTHDLLNTLAEHMTPWNRIKALPSNGSAADQVADLRPKYLNMTANGLAIIGHVAFETNKLLHDNKEGRLEMYRRLATEIDWRRDAAIWQDVIMIGGKLATQRQHAKRAAEKVMEALGLSDLKKDKGLGLSFSEPA